MTRSRQRRESIHWDISNQGPEVTSGVEDAESLKGCLLLLLRRSAVSLMFVATIPRHQFNAPLHRCAPPENRPGREGVGDYVRADRATVPRSPVKVQVAGVPKSGLQTLPQAPPA
ncbi:hypothetical protein NDU88_003557 [Pleurodeles waltl]|uniref:Uncharacterized protein n=1 Tax=Pleurodeles waltl TaxID=8319 RepID=A0AAV7LSD8_PLEWA|nr:hypothetical protein NDU88_003557 [Pleurodeles waltl]